jgi:hypothetical protein
MNRLASGGLSSTDKVGTSHIRLLAASYGGADHDVVFCTERPQLLPWQQAFSTGMLLTYGGLLQYQYGLEHGSGDRRTTGSNQCASTGVANPGVQ